MTIDNLNIQPYADLYEQETGRTMASGMRLFLRAFAQEVAQFRAWGAWDHRSGIICMTREQVQFHARNYLTGGVFMDRLPAFAERLVDALTAAYLEGYEDIPVELIAQPEADSES